MKTKILALGLICIFLSSFLIAQEKPKIEKNLKATTEDGRKVLLKTDGTWEFIKEEAKVDKPASITVYITKTGGKYHRSSCSYLRRSKIIISLKDACARGYTPCSRCNPPRCK